MAENYIADHAARARGELLSVFHDKPRIEALVRSMAEAVQRLEDDMFDLLVSSGLTAATGAILDNWGNLVDEPRLGLGDTEYRRIINAKLAAIRSSSTEDEIYEILLLLTSPESARTGAKYPAEIRTEFTSTPSPLTAAGISRVARILQISKGAGITITSVEGTPGHFRFDDTERGFGSVLSRRIL